MDIIEHKKLAKLLETYHTPDGIWPIPSNDNAVPTESTGVLYSSFDLEINVIQYYEDDRFELRRKSDDSVLTPVETITFINSKLSEPRFAPVGKSTDHIKSLNFVRDYSNPQAFLDHKFKLTDEKKLELANKAMQLINPIEQAEGIDFQEQLYILKFAHDYVVQHVAPKKGIKIREEHKKELSSQTAEKILAKRDKLNKIKIAKQDLDAGYSEKEKRLRKFMRTMDLNPDNPADLEQAKEALPFYFKNSA